MPENGSAPPSIPHLLQQAFGPIYEAPVSVWETFAEYCELTSFKKNQVIKKAGAIENNGFFILEGAATNLVWKGPQMLCLDFFFEGDFFGDSLSLYTREPSPVECMAIENCTAMRISRESQDELRQTEIGKLLFHMAAENDFVVKQRQQIDLLLMTPEERYLKMERETPEIILRLPQKFIASYLGITTQSLSRLRRRQGAT